jgi:hypothetical protein
MMAPALLQIENEFQGTSSMVMNFAVSIYVSLSVTHRWASADPSLI